MNKRTIFILTAVCATLVIIVSIIVIIASNKNPQQLPTPTPPPVKQLSTPPVSYDQTKSKQLLAYVKQKDLISDNGRTARNQLLVSINDSSSTLISTVDYTIEYVKSPDIFMVEIKSPNINQVKQDVQNYFFAKGIKEKDICYLPLTFYLNRSLMQSLGSAKIIFSPLPLGC